MLRGAVMGKNPVNRNRLLEARKGARFKPGGGMLVESLFESPQFPGLKGSTLTFPRMHWIFPLYPCTTATVTLALLPAPARFPSQEHFANAGLYLAATARYSLFSMRS